MFIQCSGPRKASAGALKRSTLHKTRGSWVLAGFGRNNSDSCVDSELLHISEDSQMCITLFEESPL